MAEWWDQLGTNIGNALIAPQTFGGLMPVDPAQRQQMIGPALINLGAGLFQGARQGHGPLEAFSSAYGGLQQQGAQQGQQRLQGMLLGSKLQEQRKRNQTKEALKKNPPAGMTPEMIDVLSDEQIGKLWMDSITRDRARSTMSIGDFPGMSGGPSGAPTGTYNDKLATVESPTGADNQKGSGAAGYYQFMPGTAHQLAQQTAWGKGLSPDQVMAAIREEVRTLPRGQAGPKQQELLSLYHRQTDPALTAAGMPINDANRYAVHWFGAGGGPSLLRADPNMPVAEWVKTVKWDKGVTPEAVMAQNNLARFRTVGDLRDAIARLMGGGSPQVPTMQTAGVTAPNPAAGGDGAVVPAQYTPPAQGAPAAPAAPAIDYQNDPVIREAFRAAQRARAIGDERAWQEARQRAAARVAELQKQAQARDDRAGQVVELEDGKWLVDPRTGDKIKRIGDRPTPRGEGREFTEEDQLRSQYFTQNKTFGTVRDHYSRITAAASEGLKGKPSPAGDIALIYSYMKMIDPEGAVREGDYATASNAGGVPERIRIMYNKAIDGELLTNDMRADFVDRSGKIYERALKGHRASLDTFRDLARRYKLDPDRVAPDLSQGVEITPFTPAGTKPPTGEVKKGTRMVNPQTGQEVLWDGKQWLDVKTLKPVTSGASEPKPAR